MTSKILMDIMRHFTLIIDFCAIFIRGLYIETKSFDLKASLKYKKIQYGPWMLVVQGFLFIQVTVSLCRFICKTLFL